jgi:ferredoxin
LRYAAIDRKRLPLEIVDKEIKQILKLNIKFKPSRRIGRDIAFDDLCKESDAVLVAVGEPGLYDKNDFSLDEKAGMIQINRSTCQTSRPGVFAAGGVIGSRRWCVRAVADGREAAQSILAFWDAKRYAVVGGGFTSRMGTLSPQENAALLTLANPEPRQEPSEPTAGVTSQQARAEARRCLHCDCRKADHCRLRDLAAAVEAKQNTWPGERKKLSLLTSENKIVYEPGKCIQCGLCIQTARRHAETTGLAFAGRGFAMTVAVPFDRTLAQALTVAGEQCVKNCPTGALALIT